MAGSLLKDLRRLRQRPDLDLQRGELIVLVFDLGIQLNGLIQFVLQAFQIRYRCCCQVWDNFHRPAVL